MIIEVIPYKNFKEKLKIVKEAQEENKHVEVWDKLIYTATKNKDMEDERWEI